MRTFPMVALAASSVAILAAAPLATPVNSPKGLTTTRIYDNPCPKGYHRDAAALNQAGDDPKAIAQVPCVQDGSATANTVDSAKLSPAARAALKAQPNAVPLQTPLPPPK